MIYRSTEHKIVWVIEAHAVTEPFLIALDGVVHSFGTRQKARGYIKQYKLNPYRFRPVKATRSYEF